MIKFFRKIRRNLLSERKTGKYLKYAIGEIILVVLGILIAVSINNWNEKRKDHLIELQLLSQLKVDTKVSLEQLNDKIRSVNFSKKWDSITLNIISEKTYKISNDSLLFLITGYVSPPTFDPEDSTIKSILNSGKLDILSSQELRNHISSWESYLNEVYEIEELLTNFYFNQKKTYLRKYIPFRNRRINTHGKSHHSDQYDKIISDLEFENIVDQSFIFNTMLSIRYNKLKGKMMNILSIIEDKTQDK